MAAIQAKTRKLTSYRGRQLFPNVVGTMKSAQPPHIMRHDVFPAHEKFLKGEKLIPTPQPMRTSNLSEHARPTSVLSAMCAKSFPAETATTLCRDSAPSHIIAHGLAGASLITYVHTASALPVF